MTEGECVAIGGHCYEITNEVLTSQPPQRIRICKHCGKRQIGQQRPDMDWSDW